MPKRNVVAKHTFGRYRNTKNPILGYILLKAELDTKFYGVTLSSCNVSP